MTAYLKIIIIYILRIILRIAYIFPIKKNRVIFISYEGKQYACNPKYIFEYMYKNYGNIYQYIWCLNNKNLFNQEYQIFDFVKFLSAKYFFYILTCKYIISNVSPEPFFPFRKQQIVVNTWHGGGAYKKISIYADVYRKQLVPMRIKRRLRSHATNYVISACEQFTYHLSRDWNIPSHKFLPIGMPRNDIFFTNTYNFSKKLREYYNINETSRLALYAPTYRGNPRSPLLNSIFSQIDTVKVLSSLSKKFNNEFVLLYRCHHNYNNIVDNTSNNIISASDYSDMQELLYVADILITDYSSCMWDFSFTFRPCFLYVPDMEKYNKEWGFYTPIEKWPFPIAKTNDELIKNIHDFDNQCYISKVKRHHIDLDSYEDGNAAKNFCNSIFE
jgi:CDP-glycerol glycerophosphotransferase